MSKELNTIKQKIADATPILISKYNLDFLVLFGSVAKGKARPNSDVDIGFKGNIDFQASLQLAVDLSEILKTDHVDLVDMSTASPLIQYLASHEGILLYEKENGIFADFKIYAFKHFIETQPLRDLNFKRTLTYLGMLKTI